MTKKPFFKANAQDFISEERNTFIEQIEAEEEASIDNFLAWSR